MRTRTSTVRRRSRTEHPGPRVVRLGAAAALGGLVLLAPTSAHAEPTDGVYGRLGGDAVVMGGLGLVGERGGPAGEAHLGISYLATAGPYLRYTEAFGRQGMVTARSVAFGAELRPLFLARYALDLQQGPAHLDLFLDSLAITTGVVFSAAPGEPMDDRPGFEFGLGLEVPVLPQADGPRLGISGVLRWRAQDFEREAPDLLDRGSLLLLTLTYHHVVSLGLVDARDGRDDR